VSGTGTRCEELREGVQSCNVIGSVWLDFDTEI
jgi:hypothetical protein